MKELERNEPKLVIGYARVSQEGEDIQRQVHDLTVAGVPAHLVFRDDIVSGVRLPGKRPGYSQMLKTIETGTVTDLWVTDLSRFGRDARGTLQELWSLEDRGITIHSLSQLDQVALNVQREYQPIVQAGVLLGADLQRKKVIEDTKSGLARARARGSKLGRPTVQINPEKIKVFTDRGLSEHAAFLAAGYKRSTFYRWKRAQKNKSTGEEGIEKHGQTKSE
ncbi:recombinase family protein [Patescibacteria group bacterium]|nr:recombinase family protein [Patescibacteria group bacterium]